MSIENDGAFFRIVEEAFTPTELEALEFESAPQEQIAELYVYEPLWFGREYLLEVFHEVLDWSMSDRQENEWPELVAKFGNAITPSLDIRPDDAMLIEGPQVFIDSNGPGGIFMGHKVAGTFAGFTADKLFFVDQASDEDDPALVETGEIGLYVVLQNAHIEVMDEQISLLGNTLVSLSNGTPVLYKKPNV